MWYLSARSPDHEMTPNDEETNPRPKAKGETGAPCEVDRGLPRGSPLGTRRRGVSACETSVWRQSQTDHVCMAGGCFQRVCESNK
jgi:hypothetical protein